MKFVISAVVLVLLAGQRVRSAEPSRTNTADRLPVGIIEFYDDEADYGGDLPPNSQTAEYLKMITTMTPRVHNIIRSKVVSPNGQRVVYVVERDAGATTAESLHAFMGIPASPSEESKFNEKMLGDRIFMGDKMTAHVSVEWKDDKQLIIYSDGEVSFVSTEHDGISIFHKPLDSTQNPVAGDR